MTSYTTKTTTLAKDCLNSREEDGVHEKNKAAEAPDRIIKSEGSSILEVCKTITHLLWKSQKSQIYQNSQINFQ